MPYIECRPFWELVRRSRPTTHSRYTPRISGASASLRDRAIPIIVIAVCVVVQGCSPSSDSRATVPAPAKTPTGEVVVEPIDRGGYDRFLAGHRGEVVLIDFWATWCSSCLEGFPHTVRWQALYGERGLVVASVAINEEEDHPQLVDFLRSQSADFAHFRSAHGGGAAAMEAFQISSGTLPTLKLYDRKGQLRHTFGDGQPFGHAQIEAAIRQLLDES